MKKNITLSMIATVALVSLVGCGGGGSSSSVKTGSSSSVKTGTGYYVDNAGVDYVCGTQKGKTDKDGKFTFEKSKECTFTLADIPLRTTPSSDLLDGKKILEDDPKVAKFLQSIDADGDLSNGIQITDEVITAVTKALKENDISTNSVPEGEDLVEVVASVGNDIPAVSGDVRTDEEVQGHLTQTQTDITKELLAGKTFYVVGSDDGEVKLFKLIVNNEATSINVYTLDDTLIEKNVAIQIVGNKLLFADNTDGSYTLISQEDGYIFGDDRFSDGSKDGIGHRLYTSQSDAQAYYDSLNENTQTEITKTLLSQNPWYRIEYTENEAYCDGRFTFDMNNHLTAAWKEDGQTHTVSGNYSLEDGKLITVHNDEKNTETLLSKDENSFTTEDVITNNETGASLHQEKIKYFKNRADAVSFGKEKGVDCSVNLP